MTPEPAACQRVDVSTHPAAEYSEIHGCRIVVRRIDGAHAREIFLHCRPPADSQDTSRQASAVYRAIFDALLKAGATPASVVSETVFVRDLGAIGSVREARRRAESAHGASGKGAATEIEQAPLDERAMLEVSLQAVVPTRTVSQPLLIRGRPVCGCSECARTHGLRVQVGDERRFYASGIYGSGEDARQQTLTMFAHAEDLLRQAGMDFGDVVRTWIYLRDIDRDYADLNGARRAFFEARGVDPVPASTGIGAGLVPPAHDLCLAIYALRGSGPARRTVMTSPTLNEASQYGADFVRGMKMAESNKIALHVSGTASIDEEGRTAHVGDFDAQADRMLVNIEALLRGQGADFRDVLSAVTYVKHPRDAARLEEKLRGAGFEGFPHALVAAPICRPELLCETEVLAVVPEPEAAD